MLKGIKRISSLRLFSIEEAFAKRALFLLIASAIGSVFSYLYLLFAGRSLGTETYGIFGSLFGIFYIFSLLGDALRITIADRVASLKDKIGNSNAVISVMRPLLLTMAIMFLFISMIMINSGRIASFLHMSNSGPVFILGISLLTTLFLFIVLGLIQGLQLFSWLAAIGYLIPQVFKLFFGLFFVQAGWGLVGMVGALFASNLIAIIVGIFPLIKIVVLANKDSKNYFSPSFIKLLLPALLIGMIICIPTSVDVMLVTHFFTPYDAGIYNATATMGKIVLFSPIAISLVMLPSVSIRHSHGKNTTNIIGLSLVGAVIISSIIVLLYWVFGTNLVSLFFGSAYHEATRLIVWYGIAMILFTANYLLAQYNLALSKYRWLLISVAVSLSEVVAIVLLHHSLLQVIMMLVVGNLTMLALNSLSLMFPHKKSGSHTEVGSDAKATNET